MKVISLILVLSIPLMFAGNTINVNLSLEEKVEVVESVEISYDTLSLSELLPESLKQVESKYMFTWCYEVEETPYNEKAKVCYDIYEESRYCCGNVCSHSIKICQGCMDVCSENRIVQ
jgi:hypothetical protein